MSSLALPGLPDTWRPIAIGELASIVYGEGLRAEERANQGGIPVYGSGGLVGEHNQALNGGPSIVIGRKGSVGSIYYMPGPFWCIDTAFYLDNITSFVDVEFLAHVLQFIDLSRLSMTVGVPGINRQDIAKQKIPLPPLPEQQRIATILRHAADLRRQRREADELARKLLPALFYEMFGDPASNPKAWNKKRLAEVGELDRGRSRNRPRDAAHLYGGPYPFIQTGDIANAGGWITEYSQTYSEAGLAQSRMWTKDTLAITIAANIARTAILTFDACFPDSVVGFVPSADVTVEFVRQWFQTVQGRLETMAPQGAQKNINLEILRELRIITPPIELQEQFARAVNECRTIFIEQKAESDSLNMLFQSLLFQALSGKFTKTWRDQHAIELREAAKKRDEWLKMRGLQRSTVGAAVVESPVISGNTLLTCLSPVQQRVYALTQNHPATYFTLQTLWDAQNDDASLDRDIIERGLSMLETLGVILNMRVPVSPTGEAFYQSVYRRAAVPRLEDELRALKDRFPNIRQ